MVQQIISTALGKAIKSVASLRGGGSALPGLVVEKVDPKFLSRTLSQLPMGVVIVSGTNGKTTTTKIVVELLESIGLKVFTNKTGSNFSRGIVAALLGEIDGLGKLNADIAVLELDEAWAAKFVSHVKPAYSLLLNVLRDQLDRFGEIDTTAKFLEKIARSTTGTVVLNRDDPRIFALASDIDARTSYFGTTDELLSLIRTDDSLKSDSGIANSQIKARALLSDINKPSGATFTIDGHELSTDLQLRGIYNLVNAAAAISLVKEIIDDHKLEATSRQLIDTLTDIKPAFGRGETIELDGTTIELILVKNPSGFRLALLSSAESTPTMIAINDNYADGRDMSWLWDVDFESFQQSGVDVVSGSRAYDMALRLKYDLVDVRLIDPDLTSSLKTFISQKPDTPKKIYCTYTAMLTIRKELAKNTKVERVR